MDFQGVRPDFVKFEMRNTSGQPPWLEPPKKPGFFGRPLSGVGRIFGAVAAPFSFIFPPAALVAAGNYGLANVGDQIQMRHYQRLQESQAAKSLQNTSFPGLDFGGGVQPASGTPAPTPYHQMVMDVLFARGDASLSMTELL